MVSPWSKHRCPVNLEGIGSKSTYAATEASSLALASNRCVSIRSVNRRPRPKSRRPAQLGPSGADGWAGPAFSPTPYGVAIGLQSAGHLRPRLFLEPLEPLREVVGEDVGSSAVVCDAVEAWHKGSQSTAVCPLLCGHRDPISASFMPREVQVRPERLPIPFLLACFFLLPATGRAR